MKYFHTFSSLKCLGQRLDGVNESVKLCHINPPVLWVPQLNVHNKPGRPSPTPPIAPVAVATVASGCSVARGAGAVSGPGWRVTLSLSRSVRWTTEVAVLSLSLSLPLPQKQQAPNQKLQPSRRCEQEVMRNDTSPLTSPGSERAQLRARSPESKLAFARINPLPL